MNRLEEFLQDLDTKNRIFLYLSVVVVAITIYYNLNYNYLSDKIDKNKEEIKKLKKESKIDINVYNKKIVTLKKEHKKLTVLRNEKFKDLKYLNVRLNLSSLKIDDNKFYSILKNILSETGTLGLSPNFAITQNVDKFKTYTIEINGILPYCGEKSLFTFVKFLESQSVVNNIDKLSFDKNSSTFYIKYNMWGIK